MKTKRRYLFRIGALLLALALLGVALPGTNARLSAAPGAPVAGPFQAAPMDALTEVTCELVDGTRTCELWAVAGALALPDGASVPVWGFAESGTGPAQVPGPVIRANVGETLQIVLHNEIAGEDVALAFPGQELIPDLVGVPAGGTATYSLGLAKAGTFLYEAGLTPGGARQVAMGLYGALVVEPAAVASAQEVILVFSEVDPAFHVAPATFSMFDYQPSYWLINGQAWPDTGYTDVVSGTTVLLRYLNAGVEHRTIGLLGLDQQVIAADGEPLPFTRGSGAEPLAPGETKEALVQVPSNVSDGVLYPLYNASLHQHNNNQRLADGRVAFGGMLTFLRVTDGASPGQAGPVASNVSVSPQKTDGDAPVTLSATLTDADENVVSYEYYVDQPGTLAGAGTVDVPALSVGVTVEFTVADLDILPSGEHVFYIRGQDELGNWGAPGSAVLYLDKAGPNISGMSIKPNPTNGTVDVLLSATADDRATGSSLVVSAEYSLNGGTSWVPMALSTTGTSVKALTATVPGTDVLALGEGSHPLMVQATDEWGNVSSPAGVIDLVVDATGPDVLSVNLEPDALDFNQALPVTSVRLTATVEDPVSGGVNSTLANAQGFVGALGDPGTGFDLYPADGLFDETVEEVYYNIPVSHFGTLGDGTHTVYVVGQDKAGNWGPAGSATIQVTAAVVDNEPPVVSNLSIAPGQGNRIVLTGLATDNQSIDSAMWYVESDPTISGQMSATDGAFDSGSEFIEATIQANQLPRGTSTIVVLALDTAGNWSLDATIQHTR